ncbi:6,7-dimethyl-8-ribityllumazine synthase [soil metagenome]
MNRTSGSQTSSTGQALPAGSGLRVAVISSSWHADIVKQARTSLVVELERHGVSADQIDSFEVPGAFEIPLHAKRLARTARYDAIVACGMVVDGGVYRHDFVATAVIDGLMRVQLDTDVPVFSVVLTPHHFHEHDDHVGFYTEHFVKKGIEAAHACLATVASLRALPTSR